MRKHFLASVFGVALALLVCELFFSVLENGRVAETRKLNGIGEEEDWLITGQVLAPPSERACYQGPVGNPRRFLEPHPELGYRLRPGLRALPGRLRRGGASLYDVTYSTYDTGWRAGLSTGAGVGVALFLGDSYTFGHGLKDEETLPSRFAAHGGPNPVNLGVPGWGAQQALRALELGLEKKAVQMAGPKLKVAYFLLTKEMLPRLAGLRLESEGSPFYKFGEGPPKFAGVYPKRGGPLALRLCSLSALCEAARAWLRISAMDRYELPPETSRQLAAVLSRIEDLLRDRYGYHRFRVISWNTGGDPVMDTLEGDIKERGIDIISVRSFLPGFPSQGYAIPGDGHPTAKAADEIAEFLATEK